MTGAAAPPTGQPTARLNEDKAMKKYVYIDFENVSDLEELPTTEGSKYFVFIGNKQTKIPTKIALSANDGFSKLIQISGSSQNALDFHIAFYLGREIEKRITEKSEENIQYFIVSKDTGYDPVIEHIRTILPGIEIHRIENLNNYEKTKENDYTEKVHAQIKEFFKSRQKEGWCLIAQLGQEFKGKITWKTLGNGIKGCKSFLEAFNTLYEVKGTQFKCR